MNAGRVGALSIICTDRHQHDPVQVASLVVRDEGETWRVSFDYPAPDSRTNDRPERIQYDFDKPSRRGVVEVRCIRCGRTARHPMSEWARLAVAAVTRRGARLDLSQLPPRLSVSG